jgi:hypothetical protein
MTPEQKARLWSPTADIIRAQITEAEGKAQDASMAFSIAYTEAHRAGLEHEPACAVTATEHHASVAADSIVRHLRGALTAYVVYAHHADPAAHLVPHGDMPSEAMEIACYIARRDAAADLKGRLTAAGLTEGSKAPDACPTCGAGHTSPIGRAMCAAFAPEQDEPAPSAGASP